MLSWATPEDLCTFMPNSPTLAVQKHREGEASGSGHPSNVLQDSCSNFANSSVKIGLRESVEPAILEIILCMIIM